VHMALLTLELSGELERDDSAAVRLTGKSG